MKYFLLICGLAFFTQISSAEIVQPNEQALDEDLNFRLVDEQVKKRQIASDKDSEDLDKEGDEERDIASDEEPSSSKIKYWKY